MRGLKPATTEAVFAKGIEKLYAVDGASTGARSGSLRSVMLIRDRGSGDTKSLGFGYAWFHDVADASAALHRARELGDNLTISSQKISIDMPHKGVFPRTDFAGHDTEDRYTFLMPETGERHEYKDARYYPTEMIVNTDAPARAYGSDPAEKSKSTANTAKRAKKHALCSELQEAAQKRINMTPAMAALSSRWSSHRIDFHDNEDADAIDTQGSHEPSRGVNGTAQVGVPASAQSRPVQSFAYDNPPKSCCFLCNRLLGDSPKLKAHIEKSQLHATNLGSETTVKNAYQRMKKAGVAVDATVVQAESVPLPLPSSSDQALTQYVDRAAIRRRKESTRSSATNYDKPRGFSLKSAKPCSKPDTDDDSSAVTNLSRGLGMLQKHGYKTGEGLGATGSEGLAVPISTDLYAAGVGLGHAGGKVGDAVTEAARATKGDQAGYTDKVKEISRSRYDEAIKREG